MTVNIVLQVSFIYSYKINYSFLSKYANWWYWQIKQEKDGHGVSKKIIFRDQFFNVQ